MHEPLATPRPPVRHLLERALAVVHALPPGHIDRPGVLHRVGMAAARAGEAELSQGLLDALDSPAHRAHLLAHLARQADRAGRLDDARALAQDAVLALDGSGRWRPVLPDWVGKDSARADLCALLITLGDDRSASVVSRPVAAGTVWHVGVVGALAHLLPATDGWQMVAEAVRAIPSAVDRARAVTQLLGTGVPRPRLGPDASAALCVIDAVVQGESQGHDPKASLAGARVAARLARLLLDVPALTAAVDAWGQAVALAHQLPPAHPDGVAVLCTVARDQIRRVGPGPALVTWQGLLERLHDTPLPPAPPQRGPWAEVLALALHHPNLAAPLSRVIARHTAVPSAWAHALGLLHIRAGRPERALRVAEVLSEAAARHEEDHESKLLAGLLCARAGQVDRAWDDLLGALEPSSARVVWLAGADGPQAYEVWAVDALLDGGGTELALLLSRLVAVPGLRARLLARCLHRTPAGEGAAALAEEAAASISEAHASGEQVVVDAWLAQLPRAAWESGDPAGAEALLDLLVGGMVSASVPAWLDGITHLHAMLGHLGAAADAVATPLVEGWQRRLDTAEPDDEVDLLLGWLSVQSAAVAQSS